MAAPSISPAFVARAPHVVDPRILTVTFDSQLLATQALHAAMGLQNDDSLVVHDAIVLSGAKLGAAHIVATMDPTAVAAAVPASLLGALVGTLLAGPVGLLVGGALGGGSGALLAKLADTGIPAHVVTALRESVAPGQYMLALLVSERDRGALSAYAMRCGSVGRSTILSYW